MNLPTGDAPNSHAVGTFGTSPAEQARMPEASGGRSSGTFGKENMKLSANAVAVLFILILVASGFMLMSTPYGRAWFWLFLALYPSSNIDSSVGLAVFGLFMAAVYFSLIMYASIRNKAVYAWVAIALLGLSGTAGYVRLSISRSKSFRGKAHSSHIEGKIWAEQTRAVNRWP